jgi:hypothetical protein
VRIVKAHGALWSTCVSLALAAFAGCSDASYEGAGGRRHLGGTAAVDGGSGFGGGGGGGSGGPAAPASDDDAGAVGDDAGPVGTPPPPDPTLTAQQCGVCHATIYQQWTQSMHSHGLTSPTMIAQTNQDLTGPFAGTTGPDPQKFCVNCHSPNVAASTTQANLPPPASTQWKDGTSCLTCHQFDGTPEKGSGAFAGHYQGDGFQQGFLQGKTFVGPLDAPVGNKVHASNSSGKDFAPNPNKLCSNCHEVWIDYDHDGVVEKGLDLALQTTWDEYTEYRTLGGQETCVSCHMPVVPGLTRVADGAQIPSQQLTDAPPRQVHDHSFVGVDFALDTPAQGQATLAARTALLQKAVYFTIDRRSIQAGNGDVSFDVFIANSGTGHSVPTGFAFARQMWVEIVATDGTGQVLFQSGVLAQPTDDLCDGDSLFEFGNPMKRFFQSCPRVDDELVTFQQKLVSIAGFQADGSDPFDPAGLTKAFQIGNETWLQYLHGGVVARQRTFDGTQQAALKVFEQRELHYDVPVGNAGRVHVSARLLFRALPPYFLRALASQQPASETPQIAPLIGNLDTIVMATDEVDL